MASSITNTQIAIVLARLADCVPAAARVSRGVVVIRVLLERVRFPGISRVALMGGQPLVNRSVRAVRAEPALLNEGLGPELLTTTAAR